MAYIGQQPFQEFTNPPTKDSFTGDGSTTTFDLNAEVPGGSQNALEVYVDNVRQEPGSGKAFTLGVDGSGDTKRITFSAAPANGASIYVINDKTNASLVAPLQNDLNGTELILDGDADTSLHASTDDQIDVKIAGADDFTFTANTFTALAGSSIVVPDSGLTLGSTAITSTAAEINLIDGGTSRGTTAVADADGILHNDGGTMRMTSAATFKTYFQEGLSLAYDDFTIGDAAVLITTSSGNITVDAAANDSDIIFKGTDGGVDTTFLTIDGSAAGDATFNNQIIVGDGKLVLNSTAVTSTAAEINLIDGGTSRGTTAIADADGLLINDDGTMRMTTAATVKTYMQTGLTSNSILDADSDTKIQVEEGTDEDIIRYDVAGAEVATQTARGFEFTAVGGFVMNQTTNSQTFTIASTENAIVGGPIALSGTITVEGSLAVV
jgi:hypothetical protein